MFNKVFRWEDLDITNKALLFFECTLLRDLGGVVAGTVVQCITFDLINGIMSLEQGSDVIGRFDVDLNIGNSRWNDESVVYRQVQRHGGTGESGQLE